VTFQLWDPPTDLPAPWPPEQELWLMLASAAGNDSGIPQAILDAKAEEVRKRKEVQDAITVRRRQPSPAFLHLRVGICMSLSMPTTERAPTPLRWDLQLAVPCLSTARCRQQNTSQSYSRQVRASCCLTGSESIDSMTQAVEHPSRRVSGRRG
jgi:hypothetical protein